YRLFAPLLPHLRAAAERAEPLFPSERDPEPAADVARLWNGLGYHLHAVADYTGARESCERALRIDEAAFGPDHPNVARDVNNLGLVLQALGDLAGARKCFERALGIFQAKLPPDHPHIRTVEGNLRALEATG
ncbi:MAG: tetratricopeptide repeat protein, partial [Thermoflexales bacterium]|nr:tetratricopeptide repeat protein [Thermoflexales bacterium]